MPVCCGRLKIILVKYKINIHSSPFRSVPAVVKLNIKLRKKKKNKRKKLKANKHKEDLRRRKR